MVKKLDISTEKHPDTFTLVDEDDYQKFSQHKWHLNGDGYVRRSPRINGVKTHVSLHREIMEAPKGTHVDHINGDPLDNRKANLRLVTNSQNQMNRVPNAGRKYKGVFKNSKTGDWEARIGINRENQGYKYLGIFKTQEEAAQAYNVAAQMIFGKFAKLNDVETPKFCELVKLWNQVKNARPPGS